jgi:hypothetical protein
VILTKQAIMNLSAVLEGMNIDDDDELELLTMILSDRPYLIIGEPDEYGKVTKLVIDDIDQWSLQNI